jgi:hypothetical protein
MWSKLDDALMDHRKIFLAGDKLGRDGAGIAIGVFALGLMWTNKHLTDGHLPSEVVRRWPHVHDPLRVATALVDAGLWEHSNGGYRIHDFHDHNFQAAAVQERRAHVRAVRQKAGRAGGLASVLSKQANRQAKRKQV